MQRAISRLRPQGAKAATNLLPGMVTKFLKLVAKFLKIVTHFPTLVTNLAKIVTNLGKIATKHFKRIVLQGCCLETDTKPEDHNHFRKRQFVHKMFVHNFRAP